MQKNIVIPQSPAVTAYLSGSKLKSIPFPWDMNTLDSIQIKHGLNIEDIQFVNQEPIQVSISDDSYTVFSMLFKKGGGFTIYKDVIELHRPKNGDYDGPKYSNPSVTRGHLLLFYKPK